MLDTVGIVRQLGTSLSAIKSTLGDRLTQYTDRFNNNVVAGVRGGRPKKLDGKALADYLLENPNVTARTAAEYFGVSESTIQKREEWRNRKYLAGGYAF